jgi:hypothetical protein
MIVIHITNFFKSNNQCMTRLFHFYHKIEFVPQIFHKIILSLFSMSNDLNAFKGIDMIF